MTTYRRITSAVTIAGTLALGAAPALAQPLGGYGGGAYVRQEKQLVSPSSDSGAYVRQEKQLVSPSSELVSPSSASVPASTVVHISPAGSGFDWGDAGVGAAGGFALAMLAIGGVLAVNQRRGRRGETALSS